MDEFGSGTRTNKSYHEGLNERSEEYAHLSLMRFLE